MPRHIGVDKWIFFSTLMLVVVGLAMVFSSSAITAQERFNSPYEFVGKQAIWALCGVLAMLFLMRVDYRRFNTKAFLYPAITITTLLLIAVYFFRNSHNTHRWIRFGSFFTFQPSELAKPVVVLFLAWFLSRRLDQMKDWKHTLLRAISVPVVFILLVVREPDLGTSLVLAGVTVMMLILAGMEWRYLLGILAISIPPLAALLILVPWRFKRLLVYFNPDSDPQGAGFHITQSLIAVGTGGITGHGYMEGMQKRFYLPESATDFIFANIAEELGFIGAVLILSLFVVLGVRGLRAALRTRDPFARFAAFGLTTAILLQAFFNISVVLALLPTKGIPLPLISSGGTSLFFTMAGIGILLNMTREID
jgi:cell division protein FtsW